MSVMVSVNGTMYISGSHSVVYVLYWTFQDFKNYFIYCVFKHLSCCTKMYWNLSVSYFFLSMTVIIQFQNIFNCIVNYFAFVQKSILLSSGNYNFQFLSILEIYLHKLKLTSCSNNHSQKIRICKSMYIFSAFTLIKSRGILFYIL